MHLFLQCRGAGTQGSGRLSSAPPSCTVVVVQVCGGGPSTGLEDQPKGFHTLGLIHRASTAWYQGTKFGFTSPGCQSRHLGLLTE